jgi:hypothetical protein
MYPEIDSEQRFICGPRENTWPVLRDLSHTRAPSRLHAVLVS